jgi:hypothetical protein
MGRAWIGIGPWQVPGAQKTGQKQILAPFTLELPKGGVKLALDSAAAAYRLT